jgi:hypothetical protein
MARRLASWLLCGAPLANHAAAQSLFGPITPADGTPNECGLSAYERRAGEVQEVCCADGCPNGLPQECNIDCAVRQL